MDIFDLHPSTPPLVDLVIDHSEKSLLPALISSDLSRETMTGRGMTNGRPTQLSDRMLRN